MTNKVTRTLVVLLFAALFVSPSFFAQDTTETKAAAAAAKKQAEEEKKAAEKLRKEDEKKAKEAGKNKPKNADIENIGNRDINKGWHPMAPGLESEIAIGRQASRELEQSVNLLHDPVITEYVNRVGQNIVKNSDAQVPFTIKVIESDEINAVSLPGGFFYVNSGLILAADEEAELAGVMAHEIAHVTARHAAEQQGKMSLVNILSIPAMLVGGIPGIVLQQAASIGVPIGFMHFGRAAEAEADYLGLQYMYKAGYDPSASVSFFEKLQARESARKKVSGLFSSHPPTEDRVAATKKNIETVLPAREQYLVTTSEFQKVKTMLAQLEDSRTPSDRDRAPSLRQPGRNRRNPSDPDARDGGKGDETKDPKAPADDSDAPPVLKRPQDRPQ